MRSDYNSLSSDLVYNLQMGKLSDARLSKGQDLRFRPLANSKHLYNLIKAKN